MVNSNNKGIIFVLARLAAEFILLAFLAVYTLIYGNFWLNEEIARKKIKAENAEIIQIKKNIYAPSVILVKEDDKEYEYLINSNVFEYLRNRFVNS